jgi:hypothetical protein
MSWQLSNPTNTLQDSLTPLIGHAIIPSHCGFGGFIGFGKAWITINMDVIKTIPIVDNVIYVIILFAMFYLFSYFDGLNEHLFQLLTLPSFFPLHNKSQCKATIPKLLSVCLQLPQVSGSSLFVLTMVILCGISFPQKQFLVICSANHYFRQNNVSNNTFRLGLLH